MVQSRFWTGIIALAIVFAAACGAMLDGADLVEIGVALVSGQALTAETFGLRITPHYVSFPWRPIPWLSLLAIWRTRVPLTDVQHLTGLKTGFGIERVKLRTKGMQQEMLLFAQRDNKVAFFGALSAVVPGLSMYRSS